jgi:hypothetical protein
VSVVDSQPTKRLSQALQGKAPLLVIVRREETVSAHVLEVLEQYCQGKNELVCGYAAKEDKDYSSFSDWVGDSETEKSVLVYVNTNDFNKKVYPGDLAALTQQDVAAFFEEVSKAEEPKEDDNIAPAEGSAEENAEENAAE